jgi:hypothetical protein
MKKRTFSLIFALIAFVSLLSMSETMAQISTAWTSTIESSKRPPGATVPTVTALDDTSPNREDFSVDLDAVTYDNATETTAWTAIGAATKTAIDSNWVEEVWGLNPAADITMRIVITSVERRFDNFTPGDYQQQYTAATDIFRVLGFVEWEIEAP